MTYILAEIASSHTGDVDKCKELVIQSHKAGADGVKVQIWQQSEIKGHPRFDNLKRFELTHQEWEAVAAAARIIGIDLWIELIGMDSSGFAERLKPYAWKLRNQTSLVYTKALVFWRIKKELEAFPRQIAIGEQGYPTRLEDALEELDIVRHYIEGSSEVLYADHSNIELSGYPVARMAKALGVWGIEKHICLNREELKKDSQDYISALEPDEFRDFVEAMK
jgi:sialic acid synthase SpsE